MTNQIGPDEHNASDWFWTNWAVRWIAVIFHLPLATAVLKIDIIITLSGIVAHFAG